MFNLYIRYKLNSLINLYLYSKLYLFYGVVNFGIVLNIC